MTTIAAMISADYGVMGDILRARAEEAPNHPAVIMETGEAVTYAQLDALTDRVSAALQRDGVQPGEAVAVCALSSIAYFNIIYSSGTTGTPKGIVQSHGMRWKHVFRGDAVGYGPTAVTMVSTPLYSNTTLVSFLPTISNGGTAVLMAKFDVTAVPRPRPGQPRHPRHAGAGAVPPADGVPRVRQLRPLVLPDEVLHLAPFSAELKRQVLDRWPGGLIEYYGMTEGGGSCGLAPTSSPTSCTPSASRCPATTSG
jgi:long-chain acyl-CoA synthetase